MHRELLGLIACMLIVAGGCIFDSETKKEKDKGIYTLEADQTWMRSCRGGGGLYILSMDISEDFEGEVRLKVEADPAINPELTTEVLSLHKRVAELVIHPDSTVALGYDTLRVISEHASAADTLELYLLMVYQGKNHKPIPQWQNEFVKWLEDEYPEFGIKEGQEWFGWSKYPGMSGAGFWTYLNETWEITVNLIITPSRYPDYFLLRRRGKVTPKLAARTNKDGTFTEISVKYWSEPGMLLPP